MSFLDQNSPVQCLTLGHYFVKLSLLYRKGFLVFFAFEVETLNRTIIAKGDSVTYLVGRLILWSDVLQCRRLIFGILYQLLVLKLKYVSEASPACCLDVCLCVCKKISL